MHSFFILFPVLVIVSGFALDLVHFLNFLLKEKLMDKERKIKVKAQPLWFSIIMFCLFPCLVSNHPRYNVKDYSIYGADQNQYVFHPKFNNLVPCFIS